MVKEEGGTTAGVVDHQLAPGPVASVIDAIGIISLHWRYRENALMFVSCAASCIPCGGGAPNLSPGSKPCSNLSPRNLHTPPVGLVGGTQTLEHRSSSTPCRLGRIEDQTRC